MCTVNRFMAWLLRTNPEEVIIFLSQWHHPRSLQYWQTYTHYTTSPVQVTELSTNYLPQKQLLHGAIGYQIRVKYYWSELVVSVCTSLLIFNTVWRRGIDTCTELPKREFAEIPKSYCTLYCVTDNLSHELLLISYLLPTPLSKIAHSYKKYINFHCNKDE